MRNVPHRRGGETTGGRVGGRGQCCRQPIKGGVGSLKPSAVRDWCALSRGRGSRRRPLLSKWHRGARITVSGPLRFECERRERGRRLRGAGAVGAAVREAGSSEGMGERPVWPLPPCAAWPVRGTERVAAWAAVELKAPCPFP